MNELHKAVPITIVFNYEGVAAPVEVVWNGQQCLLNGEMYFQMDRATPSTNPDTKNSYLLAGSWIKTNQPEWEEADVAAL